ncbi:MAG: hypothetical protein R3249_09100 [Nitriliruptorales bacterium]|nr:hypothetical protein [Nitriliruptorales bacterium]
MTVLIVVGVIAALVVLVVVGARLQQDVEAEYAKLVAAENLTATETPAGLSDMQSEGFDLLPAGERDASAAWGVERTIDVSVGGELANVRAGAFEWWWERREETHDQNGNRHVSWHREALMVGVVELPEDLVGAELRVAREGLLARMGIGKGGDFRVESEAFNRAFDIRVGGSEELALRLLDAGFQERYLATAGDRFFELRGRHLIVTSPSPAVGLEFRRGSSWVGSFFSRDGDLVVTSKAVIRALPGMIESAQWLLELIPEGYWRGARANNP